MEEAGSSNLPEPIKNFTFLSGVFFVIYIGIGAFRVPSLEIRSLD
jgi:hypothetical protein